MFLLRAADFVSRARVRLAVEGLARLGGRLEPLHVLLRREVPRQIRFG